MVIGRVYINDILMAIEIAIMSIALISLPAT